MLALSFTLLVVWIEPSSIEDGTWVRAGAMLIMLEFLLLHSGAFMAAGPLAFRARWQRVVWFLGFGLFYGAVMVGFAKWSRSDYIVWVLIGVVGSRLFTLVLTEDKRGTTLMLHRSAVGTVILLATAILCFIPFPELGLTESVRSAAFGSHADDALSEYPQRFFAWGIAYFLLMGIAEFFAGWAMPDWTDAQVEEAWEALKA